jgi:2-keto-3-deoxy-L-rhamnonate aldolase RhmA
MTEHSIIAPNRIKQLLHSGQSVIGTMVAELRQPVVMQLLANAGFNFVIIDNEHGPFTIETIADLSRAAQQVSLTPIVRVPEIAYPYIAQSLDAGAQGIMIPRVTGPEQVRQAVGMMKYPPQGSRGNAMSRGYTRFQSGNVGEVMAEANRQTMLVVQIETREAMDNLEEIVSVPGVDAALIGPNDLSIALDVPGQLDSLTMQAAMEKTIAACRQHGVMPALHINNLELAAKWAKAGMRMLSHSAEIGLMVQGGRTATTAIGAAFNR